MHVQEALKTLRELVSVLSQSTLEDLQVRKGEGGAVEDREKRERDERRERREEREGEREERERVRGKERESWGMRCCVRLHNIYT